MKKELLIGNGRMNINQCQSLAKNVGFDSMLFDLVGPSGRMACRWLDAYFGMFVVIGKEDDGFMMVRQIEFIPDIYCDNFRLTEKQEED
jgi:hypothetical protein